jgi:1-acylglycerone phosphate reductase
VKQYKSRGIYPIATLLPSEPSEHLDAAGITWFPLDVTKDDSIANLKHSIDAITHGQLDILVNNA